jgi:hypothetical protein
MEEKEVDKEKKRKERKTIHIFSSCVKQMHGFN